MSTDIVVEGLCNTLTGEGLRAETPHLVEEKEEKERKGQSYLLALPVELRAFILDTVIQSTRTVPPSPYERGSSHFVDVGRKCRVEAPDIRYLSWSRDEAVWYERDERTTIPNVDGLLLTSKQLRCEVLGRLKWLRRRRYWRDMTTTNTSMQTPQDTSMASTPPDDNEGETERRVRYEADIMVVAAGEIWPRWTWIPHSSRMLDELNIGVRSCGQPNTEDMFNERRGGVKPSIGWLLMSFLERLCKVGVATPRADREEEEESKSEHEQINRTSHSRGGLVIKLVIFDVISTISSPSPSSLSSSWPSSSLSAPDNAPDGSTTNGQTFTELVRELAMRPIGSSSSTTRDSTSTNKKYPAPIGSQDLCTIFHSCIGKMLTMYSWLATTSDEICHRIDNIELRHDGHLVHRWDMNQYRSIIDTQRARPRNNISPGW